MNPLQRQLPHSEDAEMAVLGACLNDGRALMECQGRITEETFYLAKHKPIWRVLAKSEEWLNLVSLSERLNTEGTLADIGGSAYLTDLMMASPTGAFVLEHVAILQDKKLRRDLIEHAYQLTAQCFDGSDESIEIAESAAKTMHGLSVGAAARRTSTLRPLVESHDRYREWTRRSEEQVVNLGKWLPSLRHDCGMLTGGEMVVVMGSTGVGKTCLAQNLSLCCAPLKVALFELELPERLTYPRYQQLAQGVSLSAVYQAHKSDDADGWHMSPKLQHVWLDSTSGLCVDEIERRVSAHNSEHADNPIRVVIVDYFQLLRGKGKDRYEKFSNEAEAAKVAAKKTDTVWVVISQVKRPTGDELEPDLFDAKETGSIENSSGLVLGIWRDENDAATLYTKVLKNTKGKSGQKVTCNYHGETMTITERFEASGIPTRRNNPSGVQ